MYYVVFSETIGFWRHITSYNSYEHKAVPIYCIFTVLVDVPTDFFFETHSDFA